MKKTIFSFMVIVLIAMTGGSAFAGGSKQDSGGAKKLRIGYTIMNIENPYFISVRQGFEDGAKELGVDVVIVDAKYDSSLQVSQVENFIASGLDGICISPIDEGSLIPLVDQAKAKGIPVITEAQTLPNANANYTVGEYEYGVVEGTMAAKWINEKLNGEGKVLIISQDNVEAVVRRGDGLQDTILKNAPKSVIIARQAGDTPEAAMKITESVLAAHPEVNVIACVNDSGAIGAYEAVKSIVKDTSKFYVGGADATAEALAKMKEPGSCYRATVDIDPYGTGKKCVQTLVKYIKEGAPAQKEVFSFTMNPVWQEDVK
jgi:ribose transport system substrate-binding protein